MPVKPYTVYMPNAIIKAIEAYKADNYISTRNAAILQLITYALKHNEIKKERVDNG